MAGKRVAIHVKGLAELSAKLDHMGPLVLGPAVRRFFDRASIIVQTSARENAPVDRGWLRNDIGIEVDTAVVPRWAKVGTSSRTRQYAAGIELGTRPHWPPPGPLAAWMTRKGMDPGPEPTGNSIYRRNEYLIARKIARRGTKARPFLRPALTRNRARIKNLLPLMADEIERAIRSLR